MYSTHTDCQTKQKELEQAVHCTVHTQTVRQNRTIRHDEPSPVREIYVRY